MKVGAEVTVDGRPALRLSDPERQMTVQDLLRHTAGLTYGARGTSLVNKAYIDAKVGDRTATNEEMVRRLVACRCCSRRASAGNTAWPSTCRVG